MSKMLLTMLALLCLSPVAHGQGTYAPSRELPKGYWGLSIGTHTRESDTFAACAYGVPDLPAACNAVNLMHDGGILDAKAGYHLNSFVAVEGRVSVLGTGSGDFALGTRFSFPNASRVVPYALTTLHFAWIRKDLGTCDIPDCILDESEYEGYGIGLGLGLEIDVRDGWSAHIEIRGVRMFSEDMQAGCYLQNCAGAPVSVDANMTYVTTQIGFLRQL